MTECKNLDPTALGLFLVAVVSLALGLFLLVDVSYGGFGELEFGTVFTLLGIMILFVAYFAYKAESQFGFTVFALVGAAVALTGYGMGSWENIVFAIIFLLTLIWSLIAKTPKLLSLILVTTTLVFLFVGLGGLMDIDAKITGIFALLNGIFALYLAFALALENKLPVI